MLQNKDYSSLNYKYAWLRRAVISYYCKCQELGETNPFYDTPDTFDNLMKFVSDIFYSYLKDDYKQIVKEK